MSVSNVYNMDCMEALKAFPDGYFELCIADPPYGINVTGRHRSQTIQVEREPDTACRRRRQTVRRKESANPRR
jgi:DNA modification methylase